MRDKKSERIDSLKNEITDIEKELARLEKWLDIFAEEKRKYSNKATIILKAADDSKAKEILNYLIDELYPVNFVKTDELHLFGISEAKSIIPEKNYLDLLNEAVSIVKIEYRENINKMRLLNPGYFYGENENLEAETEEEKIPTVKEFIDKYIAEHGIQMEAVENKSALEREICSAYNKMYPNNKKKISSFHKDLPRKS